MSTFKKMSLVAQEELDRLKQKQLVSYNPELRSMVFLKDEMDTILTRSDLPADEKLKMFQIAQHRFDALKADVLHPALTAASKSKLETVTDEAEDEAEADDEGDEEAAASPTPVMGSSTSVVDTGAPYSSVMMALPNQYQRKAAKLADFFAAHGGHFGRNSSGQMTIQGKAIPNSNYHDLIRQLYIHRTNMPVGFDTFVGELKKLNVPHHSISNSKAIQLLKPVDVFATPPQVAAQTGEGSHKPPGKRPRILYLYKL